MVDETRRMVIKGGLAALTTALAGGFLGCKDRSGKPRELPVRAISRLPAETTTLMLSRANGGRIFKCIDIQGMSLSKDGKTASFYTHNPADVILDDLVVVDESYKHPQVFSHPQLTVEGTRMSPDGEYVGVGYMVRSDLLNRLAGILEVNTGRLTQIGVPHFLSPVGTPPVSNGGTRAVFTQQDRKSEDRNSVSIYVYDAKAEELLRVEADFRMVKNTAISPDGSRVAFVYDLWGDKPDEVWGSGFEGYHVGVIDLTNPRAPRTQSIPIKGEFYLDALTNMVFSDDGSQIALRQHQDYTHIDDYSVDLKSGKVLVKRSLQAGETQDSKDLVAKTSVAILDPSNQPPGFRMSYQRAEFNDLCLSE